MKQRGITKADTIVVGTLMQNWQVLFDSMTHVRLCTYQCYTCGGKTDEGWRFNKSALPWGEDFDI